MKCYLYKFREKIHSRSAYLFILLSSVSMLSCSRWRVPAELAGKWKSDKSRITVRTSPRLMKFEFTSDSAEISININEDKTVSGHIGSTHFEQGILKKNPGNPKTTGIAYIIECGKIGKIFPSDPLENKEVEIWLVPVNGSMNAELRYTEGLAKFPMAGLVFRKNL